MSSDFDRSRNPKLVVGIHAGSQKNGAILAILIIAAGVILLLNQMGVLPRNFVATYWPIILVLGGLALTFTTRQTENRLWGGALVVAGIILLLNRLGVTHLAMRNLWPLFIILVGVALLLAAMNSPNFPGAKVEDGS